MRNENMHWHVFASSQDVVNFNFALGIDGHVCCLQSSKINALHPDGEKGRAVGNLVPRYKTSVVQLIAINTSEWDDYEA